MPEGHPLVGRTLEGRFRLTGFIGEGAMASVLRAVDLQNGGVEVAIKVMHPHLAEDRTFAGRFKREAKAAAMLQHPNSVTIIHFGEDDRIHFIVMELVRGRDLREVLRVEKRLPEIRACRLVAGVCEALDAAHKLGIIHRDLKPENVMVEQDPLVPIREHVKVLDFGIAKLVDGPPKSQVSDGAPDSEPPPQLTQVGVVVGTPAYMSPEQCRGQPLDGRSDIYTCGILLYQLVAGRVPFESESPFETAGKQAFEAPPPPSQFWPALYPPLEALILKTLSKAAIDRPQSATELRDALLQIIDEIQGRMGKTVPMMASRPLIAAAEARNAAMLQGPPAPFASQQQQQQQQGSFAGPFPTAPQGMGGPMAPPAGSAGPKGTVIQSDAYSPSAQAPLGYQGGFGQDANGPSPSNQQPPHQQQGYGWEAPQASPQGQAYPSTEAAQTAQSYPKEGYPQAPAPPSQVVGESSGVGGGLAVLFVLIAMFLGVGIGVALFRFF